MVENLPRKSNLAGDVLMNWFTIINVAVRCIQWKALNPVTQGPWKSSSITEVIELTSFILAHIVSWSYSYKIILTWHDTVLARSGWSALPPSCWGLMVSEVMQMGLYATRPCFTKYSGHYNEEGYASEQGGCINRMTWGRGPIVCSCMLFEQIYYHIMFACTKWTGRTKIMTRQQKHLLLIFPMIFNSLLDPKLLFHNLIVKFSSGSKNVDNKGKAIFVVLSLGK